MPFDFSTLDFDLSGSALTYRYEIRHASGENDGDLISGLLGSDYSDSSSNSINFDNDIDIGGAAKYDISFYVSVNDFSGSSAIDLETIDVTFDLSGSHDSLLDFSGASVDYSGSAFNYARSNYIDTSDNTVRFTGAVGAQLHAEDTSGSFTPVSSGDVSGNTYTTGVSQTNGGFKLFTLEDVSVNTEHSGSVDEFITFTNDTDVYDTTLSNVDTSGNTLIKSLDELGGTTDQDFYDDDKFSKVTVHEAQSNLVNVATNIYTQRYIGSSAKTNLIRNNNHSEGTSQAVIAESYWINTGTYSEQLSDIKIYTDTDDSYLQLISNDGSGSFTAVTDFSGSVTNQGWDVTGSYSSLETDGYRDASGAGSDVYELDGLSVMNSDISGGSLDASTMDGAKLVTHHYLDASGILNAGDQQKLFVDNGIFQLRGEQSDEDLGYADQVSSNLITFQGDLNYDGRVSLTDLAFLNAGAVAYEADASGNFSDVDADFDGDIDVADLAILSADWKQTIYDASGEGFDASGASFADFETSDSWITLTDGSGSAFILNGISELDDSTTEATIDGSANDIFGTAVNFTYDNSAYLEGFSNKDDYNSAGRLGLGDASGSLGGASYDTLLLT